MDRKDGDMAAMDGQMASFAQRSGNADSAPGSFADKAQSAQGVLSIVSTPIGNLDDITRRAVKAFERADAIYSEDTRVTKKLLSALGISGKTLKRLDENRMAHISGEVIDDLAAGRNVAYCTDAGMPAISDPGTYLVSLARREGYTVEVLPGACAFATAYVASGFASTNVYFGGFLPRKETELRSRLESLRHLDAVLVFYESPNRVVNALRGIKSAFPHREVAVCRELTKLHEEVFSGSAQEVYEEFRKREEAACIKGEIAIVISAVSADELALENSSALDGAKEYAQQLVSEDAGMRAKDISKELASKFGISRNDAYGIALDARSGAYAKREAASYGE